MLRLWLLVAAGSALSCSLITKFDQDGQPCDPNASDPAASCLSDAGYTCVGGFCTKSVAAGGSDSGFDAGYKGAGDGG